MAAVFLLMAASTVQGGEGDEENEKAAEVEGAKAPETATPTDPTPPEPEGTNVSHSATGVVYVTTRVGDVEYFNLAKQTRGTVLKGDAPGGPATQVIPADRGKRLLLLRSPERMRTTLNEIVKDKIRIIFVKGKPKGGILADWIVAFDSHAGTDVVVGHNITGRATKREIHLSPLPFRLSDPDKTDLPIGTVDAPTVGQPFWSGDRTTSAASQMPDDGSDLVTKIAVHVKGPLLNRVITWKGCTTAVIGFSPDDSLLAIRVIGYGEEKASSGIYLYDLEPDSEPRKISDETCQTGVWSPDGKWIAIALDAAPGEAKSGNTIQLINVKTKGTIEADLSPNASITTIAWIRDVVHHTR